MPQTNLLLNVVGMEEDGKDLVPSKPNSSANSLWLKGKGPKVESSHKLTGLAKETDDVIHSVERLDREQALNRLKTLAVDLEKTAFELGGVLSRFRINHWYEGKNFYHWVFEHGGINRPNARALMSVYDTIIRLGTAGEPLKAVDRSKVRVIASVVTEDNVAHWVERIKTLKTRTALEAAVREERANNANVKSLKAAAIKALKPAEWPSKSAQKAIKALKVLPPMS